MYSRQKILERFSLEPSKVTAIPLAPSPMFKPVQISERNHVLDRLGLNHPYILSLGSLEPRKNLLGLLKAWSFVQAKDVSLVISGDQGPAFADPQINSLLKHDSGVKFTGRLPDADLPSLYSGALAFVYPSFYEGFGLPPLEAMACGTPVIASGVTSLPEVCGDAALYCNPFNPEDIADKIHQLIIDSSVRNTLSSWGMEHVQHFSWVECARKTVAILKQFTY
jgi:glycosyltransferase involved in cell wall biosynthesis